MSEPKVDQVKITVLLDAGPEEMARSAGVSKDALGWAHPRRISRNRVSMEQQISGESTEQRNRPGDRVGTPGSKSGSGVNMADTQYHGKVDPDA